MNFQGILFNPVQYGLGSRRFSVFLTKQQGRELRAWIFIAGTGMSRMQFCLREPATCWEKESTHPYDCRRRWCEVNVNGTESMHSHRPCPLSAAMAEQRRFGQEGKEQPLECGKAGSDSRGTGRAPRVASLGAAGHRGGKAQLWSGNGEMSGTASEAKWMGARQAQVKTMAPSLTS